MQKVDDGHDTATSAPLDAPWLIDHVDPSNTSGCPSRSTATHMVGDEHDTSIRRSFKAPVECVWNDVHEWPLNVATVLGEPGIPPAPTAAQKWTVGQETS